MRPLRSYRVAALVLRTRDLGEADRLVTLFSRERGKIDAIVKGARRPRSKMAALQLFSLADLQLAAGRTLEVVTQATIHRPFFNIRSDIARFAYASYFAELFDALTEVGEAGEPLFDLLLAAFELLESAFDPQTATHAFELQLLDYSGYAPQLDDCVSCGAPLGAEPMGFTPALGGLIGRECLPGRSGLIRVSDETRRVLLALRTLPLPDLPAASLSLSPDVLHQMERLLRAQIAYHLDRKLNSLVMLDRLVGVGSAG